jgi:hypothetical protein
MALRTKTIEYWFPMDTAGVASATRLDFAAMTLYIPENTSRTFRSAQIDVQTGQSDTTAVSMTSWLIGIKLGATAFNDVTITDTITNSGESSTWGFTRDVTAYFNTNFGSGTSQTCQVGVTFGGPAIINCTVRLLLTYEFDDSGQTTRVKTVRVPLDCSTTTLTGTLAEIGTTNQIPQLTSGGLLPEASVVIRNWVMVTECNGCPPSSADTTIGVQFDAAAELSSGSIENAQSSAFLFRHVWDMSGLSTTAGHTFKMRSTTASRGCWQQCHMVITYEYDHSSTTTTLNHRYIPFGFRAPLATTANGADKARINFYIPEPGSITLKQSGIVLWMEANAADDITITAGSQSARTYTHTLGALTCGDYPLSQRIDAGGAVGSAAFTPAHGYNTLDIAAYAATITSVGGLSGFLLLNYVSSVDTDGCDAHSHSTHWSVWDTIADAANRVEVQIQNVVIPETNYRVSAVGIHQMDIFNAPSGYGRSIDMRVEAGDWGPAWQRVGGKGSNSGGELCLRHWALDASAFFKRTPTELDPNRVDVETASRQWRDQITTSTYTEMSLWVDYSAITYTVAGTIADYTGDGSGISVDIMDPDGVKVRTVTSSAGGGFTAEVYDARAGYYGSAQQDATHVGRSATGTPA